jgi:hypothetical protein
MGQIEEKLVCNENSKYDGSLRSYKDRAVTRWTAAHVVCLESSKGSVR